MILHEQRLQRRVVAWLRRRGCHVYVLGTRRPRGDRPWTCQTPGLPDLLVIAPERGWTLVELKARRGARLRPAQEEFAACCEAAGIPYVVWRELRDALAWLRPERETLDRGEEAS